MKRKPVKTHTFKTGKRWICADGPVLGFCEMPDDPKPGLCIVPDNTLQALQTAIEEAMHAEGITDKHIHEGQADNIGRFLWRLGWRRA